MPRALARDYGSRSGSQNSRGNSLANLARATIGGGVAWSGRMTVKHRQLVAKDGNLDVIGVWCGTEADQPGTPRMTRKTIVEPMPTILDAHRGCSEPRSCVCTLQGRA